MTEALLLADGNYLENCSCGYDEEYSIWCYLVDVSFAEAFQYFSDPEAFKTVAFIMEDYGSIYKTIYSGLTELSAIQQERERVVVRLKGADIQIEKEHIFKERDDSDGTIHNTDQNEP